MSKQNWISSTYVIIGCPSFLSSGGLAPPKKEGKPPGSLIPHVGIITIEDMTLQ